MNIKIGKYKLTSSSRDFTVTETKIKGEGEYVGQEYDADHSYHPTLQSALESVLRRGLLSSDATTLGELLIELKAARTELREIWGGKLT